MADISFFTPICYPTSSKTHHQQLLEKVDSYFFLSGQKAYVIAGHNNQVVLRNEKSSPHITALKVISYMTLLLPLLLLCIKAILRLQHRFQIMDVKKELEQGVEISPAHRAAIEGLLPKIERTEDDPRLEWLSKNPLYGLQAFRIREFPNLVFRMKASLEACNGQNEVENRFQFMLRGKETCLIHQLDLLALPQAKLFQMNVGQKTYSVIAQEFLPFQSSESAQEELYRTHARNFDETARQLAIYIMQTGCETVSWRSIPILEGAPGGPCRVGLAALRAAVFAEGTLGITGLSRSYLLDRGLVRCLFSEKQINAVLREAGMPNDPIKTIRLSEIADHHRLLDSYRRNGILENPRKPLQVNLDTLGLNLDEEGTIYVHRPSNLGPILVAKRIHMREVAETLLAKINALIQQSAEENSVKGKRFVNLNPLPFRENEEFREYLRQESWIHRILNALKARDHIFNFEFYERSPHSYFIQA